MMTAHETQEREQGAVAVLAGILLLVLVGFAGLVLDSGHLFVVKTEMQNAADACALAAARELDAAPDSLHRATNAGLAVATRNLADFQKDVVDAVADDITFGDNMNNPAAFLPASSASPTSTKYVMCTMQNQRPRQVSMWLMSVLNFGDQTVGASAMASLAPSQTHCAVPLGMCLQNGQVSAPWGFEPGHWYGGRYGAGGGQTGSYNWIDFTPPAGGASEAAELLAGEGECSLGNSGEVGQSGAVQSLALAWNTRFGLYRGSYSPSQNRPDFSGFSYTPSSWAQGNNAYPDLILHRQNRDPYQGDAASGLSTPGYRYSTAADHATYGTERRVVAVPVLNCQDWASSQTVVIRGWACALMLNPIEAPDDVVLEYLGDADDPASPCASGGFAGASNSTGPLVPTLVR